MIKWEYRVETREVGGKMVKNLDDMTVEWLNDIGKDGWELVGITTLHIGNGMTSEKATLTFKRPVRDEPYKQSAEGSDVIAELQELHNMRQINIEPPKLPIPDKPPFE